MSDKEGNLYSNSGPSARNVDATGDTRSGSAKLLVTSGSPAFWRSANVQTKTSCPRSPNAEKSSGRTTSSSVPLTANSVTADMSSESVALTSGAARNEAADSIFNGRDPAQRRVKLLRIVRRRLVEAVVVRLDDPGAETVGEVRAIGDLNEVGLAVQQVMVA